MMPEISFRLPMFWEPSITSCFGDIAEMAVHGRTWAAGKRLLPVSREQLLIGEAKKIVEEMGS